MTEKTHEKLKQIKQSFRLLMNGEANRSMREKGVNYHLNWGVSLVDLRQMAKEYGKDYELAIELWKENIRECKILATMIMPAERMLPEIVDIWIEQTQEVEIAEQAAFNLYQHLDFAPEIAFRWISSNDAIRQISGYHILSRLFMRGLEPNERGINEFLDQALAALNDSNISVRHAATTSLQRFSELGEDYSKIVDKALSKI
ncbi:MAG: DNA alkylation repair protein [Prevotella sp.]|nr:DNA alkylation repair protein [Prevotella sp.]